MVRRALAECPPGGHAPANTSVYRRMRPSSTVGASRWSPPLPDAGRLDVVTRIYLDHNATTPVAPPVADATARALRGVFGNPSSVHAYGQEAKTALDGARSAVARLIGAEPTEIVFTSGGSESDNLAIRGVLDAAGAGRRRLVASAIEHEAVLRTLRALARTGRSTALVRVDERGVVTPRAARGGPDRRHRAGLRHARQQRDRHHPARCRAGRAGPRARGSRAHRRRAVGGQDTRRRAQPGRRPAVAVRPQVQRPEGRRRPLDPARHAVARAVDGRPAGAQPSGRHREPAGHRGPSGRPRAACSRRAGRRR